MAALCKKQQIIIRPGILCKHYHSVMAQLFTVFQATMNSLFFIMVGKQHAFSPELTLFCFYALDETVRAFQFGCSAIYFNLEYLWKKVTVVLVVTYKLQADLTGVKLCPSTGDLFLTTLNFDFLFKNLTQLKYGHSSRDLIQYKNHQIKSSNENGFPTV